MLWHSLFDVAAANAGIYFIGACYGVCVSLWIAWPMFTRVASERMPQTGEVDSCKSSIPKANHTKHKEVLCLFFGHAFFPNRVEAHGYNEQTRIAHRSQQTGQAQSLTEEACDHMGS